MKTPKKTAESDFKIINLDYVLFFFLQNHTTHTPLKTIIVFRFYINVNLIVFLLIRIYLHFIELNENKLITKNYICIINRLHTI